MLTNLALAPLCRGLDPTVLADLAARMKWTRLSHGEAVLHRQDRSSEIYFLTSGAVTARSFSNDGQEVAFLRIDAPSVFGEFSAIDGLARSADVKAISDIEFARMSADDFQSMILAHPQLGLNLAQHLVRKIRGLSERVFEFGAFPVSVRVRRALLRLAQNGTSSREGIVIRPAPTHYEMATSLSTHREAVSRELAQLARRRMIRTGRQVIVILDPAALARAAGLEDG